MTEPHFYDYTDGMKTDRNLKPCACHGRFVELPIESWAERVWRRSNLLRSYLPREKIAMWGRA